MEENIYIPLLEDHRELPTREAVLSRFRQAFFLRLERGSRRGGEVPVEPLLMPATDASPDEAAPNPDDPAEAAWDEAAAAVESLEEPAEAPADAPLEDTEEPAESLFRFDEPEEAPAEEGTDDGGLFGDFDEGEPSPEDDDRH